MFFVSNFLVYTFNMSLCSHLNKICFHTTCLSYFMVSLECAVVALRTKEVKKEGLLISHSDIIVLACGRNKKEKRH